MLFKDLFLQRSDDHDRRGFGDPSWPGTEGAYHVMLSYCTLRPRHHLTLFPHLSIQCSLFPLGPGHAKKVGVQAEVQ
eukprot:scaffold58202_cov20-Tisochrysis_lutea.AAC.2